MNSLTRLVLKRPVTMIMCLLCLILFGGASVMSSRQELTPEINMPMLLVMTTYTGAQPEDMDSLISKEIESAAGIKQVCR